MPLSTSNSDSRPASGVTWKDSLVLLGIVAIFLIGHELLYRYGLPKVSRDEYRVTTEFAALVQEFPTSGPAVPVAVVGNSLLKEGVLFDEVRSGLWPEIDARRFVLENTCYYDWYYGLRKLFSSGVRPETVVLVLSREQFLASSICGDSFAYHLMRLEDLRAVARDAGLSNTETSNLVFANLSAYFASRTAVRSWVSGQVFPGLPKLTALMLARRNVASRGDPDSDEIFVRRLCLLRALAEPYGVKIVLVIPPTRQPGVRDWIAAHKGDIQATGVPVLVPLAYESLGPEYYSDRSHLNERGAKIFTPLFVQAVAQAVQGRSRPVPSDLHEAPAAESNRAAGP